jgi:hypothetical protein
MRRRNGNPVCISIKCNRVLHDYPPCKTVYYLLLLIEVSYKYRYTVYKYTIDDLIYFSFDEYEYWITGKWREG